MYFSSRNTFSEQAEKTNAVLFKLLFCFQRVTQPSKQHSYYPIQARTDYHSIEIILFHLLSYPSDKAARAFYLQDLAADIIV